jgi:hypothetical protein
MAAKIWPIEKGQGPAYPDINHIINILAKVESLPSFARSDSRQ